MQEMMKYIAELSKYFVLTGYGLFTVLGLFALIIPKEKNRAIPCKIQSGLIFIVQFFSFYQLFMASEDMQYVFFYLFMQIFLVTALVLVPAIYEKVNGILLNNMCMLTGLGISMISRLSFKKAIRQYIIAIASLVIAMFIPFLLTKIKFLRKLTWFYALVGTTMLSGVLVFGEISRGSKISFTLSGITFQPSEFVKILFLFFLAASLWDNTSFLQVILTGIVAGVQVIVLVISTDLGSALIFFIGFVFIVFIACRNYLYLLLGAAGGGLAAYISYALFDHVKIRVLAWQDPWKYIDNQGYQITQSLFAVGSGSWFGNGLLKGNPKAIPLVEADMIFSSVCEELGLLCGICVLLICLTNFIMMMIIAIQIHDRFYQIVVYGIGIMYIFQVFLTVGGGVKFIPLTGVTLPFISYGGSSIMTSMFMFFIVQGIYIRLQKEGGRYIAKNRETFEESEQEYPEDDDTDSYTE